MKGVMEAASDDGAVEIVSTRGRDSRIIISKEFFLKLLSNSPDAGRGGGGDITTSERELRLIFEKAIVSLKSNQPPKKAEPTEDVQLDW